ncbi:hypothetical protein [Streptomyces sp. SID8374]|uniref:hypothetical protein n=1 Tax=Streptomyces sp. SID8374 TaxID=2690354 RepID=UPI0031BAA0ED
MGFLLSRTGKSSLTWTHSPPVELLAESVVGERELRFAGARPAESLGDTLRIAASRGGRLEGAG